MQGCLPSPQNDPIARTPSGNGEVPELAPHHTVESEVGKVGSPTKG
jgi:hypothetical protein